ncbi:MAG: TorF family putative porin [Thiohalomonadaceae bacterium]
MAFRALFAALWLGLAGMAAAEITGELIVTTNYVWRGVSLSDDAPSVLGGFAYREAADSGLHASAHVAGVQVEEEDDDGNLETRDEQQLLAHLGYRMPVDDWRLDVGAVVYEFLRGDHFDPRENRLHPGTSNKQDFVEAYVGIGKAGAEFRYYYSDDYFGSGEVSRYYSIDYRHPLGDELSLLLHLGMLNSQAIDDHIYWLGDSAIGIVKEPFSFVITNLDDNEDGMQSRNPRFVVSWRHQISL